MTNGIDVSKYQGNIDFAKVKKSGVDFVIIKAGHGRYASQKDPYFEQNYKNAKSAGLHIGAYWYSYAESAADAVQEAKVCMSVIKGKQFDFPIFFDLEERSQFNRGRSFCDSLVKAFCGELEKSGWFTGLYISRSPLQNYISASVAKRYALWIAEYNNKCNYSGEYGMWQNSSSWKVNGINGNVDHDYCYVDYPAKIKSGGFNGFEKTDSKILDSSGYKVGDKTIGVLSYKSLLITAKKLGIINQSVDNNQTFGDGTQKATNELLKKYGCSQTGIAGEKLIKLLQDDITKKIK